MAGRVVKREGRLLGDALAKTHPHIESLLDRMTPRPGSGYVDTPMTV
ncbi:hypothetical protein ACRAWF_39530 [Streptomyces sp. L7]